MQAVISVRRVHRSQMMDHLQMMNAMKNRFQKDEHPASPIQMVAVLLVLHENQYHKISYWSYKIVRYADYMWWSSSRWCCRVHFCFCCSRFKVENKINPLMIFLLDGFAFSPRWFQRTGYFTDKIAHKDRKYAFVRVPRRLQFCLKEIVPYCYLTGWVACKSIQCEIGQRIPAGHRITAVHTSKSIFHFLTWYLKIKFQNHISHSRHVFMGLTICGQFMLSYKIISDEDSALNNYSFTSTHKYE